MIFRQPLTICLCATILGLCLAVAPTNAATTWKNANKTAGVGSPKWNKLTSHLGTSAAATNPSRNDDVTTGLFSSTASTVSIATSGTERLRVTATGSIGINTNNPATMLDVSGTIRPQAATLGAACSPLGAQSYNSSTGAPMYCNNSHIWKSAGISSCTTRSSKTYTSCSVSVSCNADEIAMGGGCSCSGGTVSQLIEGFCYCSGACSYTQAMVTCCK